MLVIGSGLLKKGRLSTGRNGRAFQIEVRAHDQRKNFGGWLIVDEYACTYVQGCMDVSVCMV